MVKRVQLGSREVILGVGWVWVHWLKFGEAGFGVLNGGKVMNKHLDKYNNNVFFRIKSV